MCESYFYSRDLINTPANILGPHQILQSAKKFLKKFSYVGSVSGEKLEKNFPLISAVGQGADENKRPLFSEFRLKKNNSKSLDFKVCSKIL